MSKQKLSDQIRRESWRPVSDDSRSDHLSAIEAAVEMEAVRARPTTPLRRRLSVIAATAALIALPAGIALAAEGSIPGDNLYPVKKVTETIRSWVDDDVVAEHRIEELERLVAADAPDDVIADQVVRATEEVDRLSIDHRLGRRLDAAAAVAPDRPSSDVRPGDGGIIDKPTPTVPTTDTTAPAITPDRSTTTTTKVDTTTTVRPPEDTYRVVGYVHAGPTCPVERFPPDPDCADQPVPGAVLVVSTEAGKELQILESNPEGRFEARLPDGTYRLIPRPYDGLLGTAPAQEFIVEGGPVELAVAYDTGIR